VDSARQSGRVLRRRFGSIGVRVPPNKRMQLTKLRAAPVLQAEVPPCAPAGKTDGGTASQLIRGVRRTNGGSEAGTLHSRRNVATM